MTKRRLANGITTIVVNRPTRTASLLVTVGTGSNFEKRRGISHFVEHMLFEGTTTRTGIDITRTIEGLGGEIGAYTSNERTSFYVKFLPRHFGKCLEVLFDVITNPAFKKEEIEKERKVIINEINQRRDEPRFFQWELFLKTMFQNHPAQFPIIGTKASVASIDREALSKYFQEYYVPNNMVVTYSGPERKVHQRIDKRFGELGHRDVRKSAYRRQKLRQRRKVVTKELTQSYLVFGYQTVARGSSDSYVLDVIRALLGKGLSGRLVNEIRTKRGLAYEVGCLHDAQIGYGFFAVYLNTHKRNLRECESIVKEQLSELQTVTRNELQEAKNFIEGEFTMEMEDCLKYADAVTFWECAGLGVDLEGYLKSIKKVSKQDILRVARKYFTGDYTIIVLKQK